MTKQKNALENIPQKQRKEDVFFNELVWLNINVFQLKKIHKFPWEDLQVKGSYLYFYYAFKRNYVSNIVLTIRKLFFDNSKGYFTIRKLKNEMVKELKSLGEEVLLDKLIENVKPVEKLLNQKEDKIELIRHTKLAHLKEDLLEMDARELDISVEELEEAVRLLNEYYKVLKKYGRNNSEVILLPLEYLSERNFVSTDIEKILDKIALDCKYLKMREEDPEAWEVVQNTWERDGVKQRRMIAVNFYRKKLFDLGPAS